MKVNIQKDPALRRTARDLLEYIAGREHAEHSVVSKEVTLTPTSLVTKMKPRVVTLTFRCTCGALCVAPATAPNLEALRNVPERRPS